MVSTRGYHSLQCILPETSGADEPAPTAENERRTTIREHARKRSSTGTRVVRPLIRRIVLSFWKDKDADLWVNQRLLVVHVRGAAPSLDKESVRGVIDEMARTQMLIRNRPAPKRTVYRLAPRFSDPTAPGYAREVDAQLVEPLPWVSPCGQFYRVGRPTRSAWLYPIQTFPHHFAKHAWMRAWLHAFHAGRLQSPDPPMGPIIVAARSAPIDLLVALQKQAGRGGPLGEAARVLDASPIARKVIRMDAARPRTSLPSPEPAEQALRILHDLCGHDHLRDILGAPLVVSPSPVLPPDWVYACLDNLASQRVGPPPHDRTVLPILDDAWEPQATTHLFQIDPLLAYCEPALRACDPMLRGTFTDHGLAWGSRSNPRLPTASGPEE